MGKKRGLTLIELAIVLVVLGVLVGMGAGIIGVLIKRIKYNESKEIVNAAVEGIIGYAISNGRLPTSADLGSAVRTTKDSYGKDLAYVYDSGLTSPSPYGFCGLTSTNITVRVCPDAACTSPTQTINNVAFIVISGDGNYNNQTAGTQAVTSSTTISVYDYGVTVDGYSDDMNRPEPYDDIVKWVSLNELQSAQGCESLTISSPSTLPSAVEDSSYFYQLKASGGRPPYTWSGTVGSGLTLNSDGTISGTVNVNTSSSTGELSGCTSSINFSATVTDSEGTDVTQNFTIPVRARAVEIVTNTLPDAYEGTSYSADIDAIGGDGSYTFSVVSGSLPSGLSLNSTTGQITGTPPTDSGCSEGVSNFSVQVSSCSESYTKGFSITVRDPDCSSSGGGGGCPVMTLNPAGGSYSATVGTSFNQSVTLSGGQPPISVLSCTPSNCNGLLFACNTSGANISGTPTAPGTCTFSVTYRDSCSPSPQTVTGNYSVNITGCPTLSIAGSLPDATNCTSYTGTINALGGVPPYSWTIVSGNLPDGIDFCTGSGSNCVLSGVPSAPRGTYTFTVRVADGCPQSASQNFSITVNDNCTGIQVQNSMTIYIGPGPIIRPNLYYRKNGGSCSLWRWGRDLTVGPTDRVRIYSNSTCSAFMCEIKYCDIKSYDVDGDCRIRIYDSNRRLDCEFGDR